MTNTLHRRLNRFLDEMTIDGLLIHHMFAGKEVEIINGK